MWTESLTVCSLQGLLVLMAVFFQQYRYKGEKVTWKGFGFVYMNLALQISAFLVLPLDFVHAHDSSDSGQHVDMILRLYWTLFYWINFFSSL